MAVTWTISTLERNTDDGVVVAHWQASDSEVVGTGDDAVTHSGSSYGTCGFTPDSTADGYVAYDRLTEETVIGWVKADVDADAVEASIASQIADSKAPAITVGVPW
jgi:hypothetical protein